MSKMKEIVSWLLVIVLTAGVAITGTLAYLTSEDSDVNTMTLGNVEIEQLEYERVVEDGKWVEAPEYKVTFGDDTYTPDELQEFTQDKPAYPAVYQEGDTKWDDRNGSQAASGAGSHQQGWAQVGAPGSNQLFDDSVKNVIDKFVFVKNTGKTDAYYRTLVAIEAPEGLSAGVIHTNFNGNSRFVKTDIGYINVEGVRYFVYEMLYNQILTPDEISRPSLLQVFLDPATTNEDCALFGETWEIKVLSQAVQAEGFADAQTALDTAFGKTVDKAVEWFGNVRPEYLVEGNTAEALTKAINEAPEGSVLTLTENIDFGTTTVTIDKDIILDLDGKTVTSSARNGVFYLKGGSSVKNGTVEHKGTVAGIKVWQAEAIEDVTVILSGKSSVGNAITGISVQEGSDTYIGSLKNVTITGTGENETYNGIETYNCNPTEGHAIGSMENVKVDVNGTALVLSAPAGTATNCTFEGDTYGINAHLKGTYNVSLKLVDCTVVGDVVVWDEPEEDKVNSGSLEIVAENTTVTGEIIITPSEEFGDRWSVTGLAN